MLLVVLPFRGAYATLTQRIRSTLFHPSSLEVSQNAGKRSRSQVNLSAGPFAPHGYRSQTFVRFGSLERRVLDGIGSRPVTIRTKRTTEVG